MIAQDSKAVSCGALRSRCLTKQAPLAYVFRVTVMARILHVLAFVSWFCVGLRDFCDHSLC